MTTWTMTQPLTDAERADLAEATVPLACDLVVRVRDGDAEGIERLAEASGWDQPTVALLVVLAAMVDDTAPVGDLLAWTDSLETVVKHRQLPLLLPAGGRPATEPCGTYAAARRHQRHGEPLDAACDRAMSEKRAQYGRARRERAAAARGEAA